MPEAGPALFAANHPSPLDSLLLHLAACRATTSSCCRGKTDAPAGSRLALRFVPHRVADMNDPATIKKVLRLLAAGKSVVLYPEGRVSRRRPAS